MLALPLRTGLRVHELSLVSSAIAQAVDAARRAGASRIRQLTFSLPSDGHVTEDAVRLLVEALGRGTAAQDAAVSFEPCTNGDFELASIDVQVDD